MDCSCGSTDAAQSAEPPASGETQGAERPDLRSFADLCRQMMRGGMPVCCVGMMEPMPVGAGEQTRTGEEQPR